MLSPSSSSPSSSSTGQYELNSVQQQLATRSNLLTARYFPYLDYNLIDKIGRFVVIHVGGITDRDNLQDPRWYRMLMESNESKSYFSKEERELIRIELTQVRATKRDEHLIEGLDRAVQLGQRIEISASNELFIYGGIPSIGGESNHSHYEYKFEWRRAGQSAVLSHSSTFRIDSAKCSDDGQYQLTISNAASRSSIDINFDITLEVPENHVFNDSREYWYYRFAQSSEDTKLQFEIPTQPNRHRTTTEVECVFTEIGVRVICPVTIPRASSVPNIHATPILLLVEFPKESSGIRKSVYPIPLPKFDKLIDMLKLKTLVARGDWDSLADDELRGVILAAIQQSNVQFNQSNVESQIESMHRSALMEYLRELVSNPSQIQVTIDKLRNPPSLKQQVLHNSPTSGGSGVIFHSASNSITSNAPPSHHRRPHHPHRPHRPHRPHHHHGKHHRQFVRTPQNRAIVKFEGIAASSTHTTAAVSASSTGPTIKNRNPLMNQTTTDMAESALVSGIATGAMILWENRSNINHNVIKFAGLETAKQAGMGALVSLGGSGVTVLLSHLSNGGSSIAKSLLGSSVKFSAVFTGLVISIEVCCHIIQCRREGKGWKEAWNSADVSRRVATGGAGLLSGMAVGALLTGPLAWVLVPTISISAAAVMDQLISWANLQSEMEVAVEIALTILGISDREQSSSRFRQLSLYAHSDRRSTLDSAELLETMNSYFLLIQHAAKLLSNQCTTENRKYMLQYNAACCNHDLS